MNGAQVPYRRRAQGLTDGRTQSVLRSHACRFGSRRSILGTGLSHRSFKSTRPAVGSTTAGFSLRRPGERQTQRAQLWRNAAREGG